MAAGTDLAEVSGLKMGQEILTQTVRSRTVVAGSYAADLYELQKCFAGMKLKKADNPVASEEFVLVPNFDSAVAGSVVQVEDKPDLEM